LTKIIDDHQNIANVRVLQDRIMDIFIIQREDYYARFVREISKSNGNDKVSKKLVEKLKAAFVEEKRKRCELETEHERALAIVSQLLNKISQLESTITQLKSRPEPPVETSPTMNIMSDLQPPKTQRRSAGRPRKNVPPPKPKTPEPSDESDSPSESSSDNEDPDEIYRKQRELIAQRRQTPLTRPSVRDEDNIETESADNPAISAYNSLDDDPWGV
jgi:hypothetical protein